MATPLGYVPPSPRDDPARADVDDLVDALHESGLLRVLAGGARTYPDLMRPVLRSLDASTIRSALALLGALSDLDPEISGRLATGIRRARTDAADAAAQPPEGIRGLVRRLRDPRTRRGLSAALAALAAVGGALHQDGPDADRSAATS